MRLSRPVPGNLFGSRKPGIAPDHRPDRLYPESRGAPGRGTAARIDRFEPDVYQGSWRLGAVQACPRARRAWHGVQRRRQGRGPARAPGGHGNFRVLAGPNAAVCRAALCPDQRAFARAAPHGATEGATRGAEGGRTQDHRTGAGAAKMSTILLVDDDPDILKLISLRLTAAGHSVKGAESGEKALAMLAASRPELVITDLKMGGIDGLTLFDEIRKQAPTLPVIILTAHGTIPDAVAATRRVAFGLQPKPVDGKHLLDQVEQALRLSGVGQGGDDGDWRRGLVTQSPKMENVLHQARLVAQSEANRVLQGPSGN